MQAKDVTTLDWNSEGSLLATGSYDGHARIWNEQVYMSAGVSICQHTSAYVSLRQYSSAYVSIRQHTSAYVSIRQHTSAYAGLV